MRAHPEEALYLPELFLARRAADAALATLETWLLLGGFGCRGGGDPFVGVELSEERPESRPSSPTAPPFSRFAAAPWLRVGKPVRLLAPFEFSADEEAILNVDCSRDHASVSW